MTMISPDTPRAAGAIPESMQAVRQVRYGRPADVLELVEVPTPTPGPGEVLVRVAAASVNPADWHLVTGEPMLLRLAEGVRRPKRTITGSDGAGTIVAVGDGVANRSVGDRVVFSHPGAFAEYVTVPAERAVWIADDVAFASAAGLPIAGVTAWQAVVENGAVEAGQRVVINGASGGVGTYATQLARELGAYVIGVCSGRNAEVVRSLGADEVIDYTEVDPAEAIRDADLVVDLVGLTPARAAAMLRDEGTWMVIGMPKDGRIVRPMLRVAWSALAFVPRRPSMSWFVAEETPERLAALADRLDDGRLTTVIDRTIPLADVGAAFDHLATQRTLGKLILEP